MSRGPSGDQSTRRRSAVPTSETGADQAPDESATETSSNTQEEGAPSGPKAEALGNQAVQSAMTGSGLGALAPVLAAQMMMAHAGMDPTLLGSDSNSSMQRAMQTGTEDVQPGLDQAIASLVGGGPLPESAMNRVETATGGTLGPVSGIPGTQPGMPRHYVDTQRAGINGASGRSSDARDHQSPDDPAHVFAAMASMKDHELDQALHAAGRELVSGLGASGLQSLLGGGEEGGEQA